MHPETGLIDFDELERTANIFKPAMIICGSSAYPRDFDYARFRAIADSCGALLMMDMAHISGLVATGEAASPFECVPLLLIARHLPLFIVVAGAGSATW